MNPFNVGLTSIPSFSANRHLWEVGQGSLDRGLPYSNKVTSHSSLSSIPSMFQPSSALNNPGSIIHYHAQSSMALNSAVSAYGLPRHQGNLYMHNEGDAHQRTGMNVSPYPMTGAIQGVTHQCTSLNSVFHRTTAPYPRTMSAQPTAGVMYPSSPSHITPVHRVLHSPHQPSIGNPFSGYGPPEHQRQSAYHQGNDLTLARPLTINTIPQMLPSSTAHAEWQQPVMPIPERSSVLFNGALAICDSEEHRSVLHKHLVPNNITCNNYHHNGGVQTLPDHSTASQLDDHNYEHAHDSNPPPTSLVQFGGIANQSNEQILIEEGSDANTTTPTLPQDHNGIQSVQPQPHVHSQDSISNEIQNLRVPSPEYLEVVNGFFAQYPPHTAFSTSVLSMSSNEEWSPNGIPQHHHSLYTPSQIPTAQHNEWAFAFQHLVEEILKERDQDPTDSSTFHQGEAEANQHLRSKSTPSSEEYLIEQKNPFNEGPDNGSLPHEAGSWTQIQHHQGVGSSTGNFPSNVPRSTEEDDFTESSQHSVHPEISLRITYQDESLKEVANAKAIRKSSPFPASETSQPERPVKRIRNSSASSASSSSPHSSPSSPPMPSQEAVPEEKNTKRKKKLLRDKMDGPFWLQRIPEQEKELVHIAETVSPAEQVPESEENEN
ncbi:hypothetical protein CPB84DRAFT_1959457 [Gymnopilus junonius]|uniref:Uncharacterized protein n=1 Tax=Gymnopilus junonius TaxID=109634 RepID=A0A9P5TQR4_GYMJU|nr:hypothetical protein CPB84DRAFT_1959457 [Gymnopilus junonius]